MFIRDNYSDRIFESSVNFSLAKKHVTTASAPQHPLEGRKTLAKNHPCDKSIRQSQQIITRKNGKDTVMMATK